MKELGQLLSNIPIKNYQAIGHYFLGIAHNRKGNGDQDEARRSFELAIDTAPDDYKVKAILSLGALSFHKRKFDSALRFYQETIKIGKLSAATMQAIKTISVVKAIEGDHKHALKDLEAILPLIKYAPAHIYFDVLNSYAVELGDIGRLDEAENISSLTISSPFAPYYSEWQYTFSEIRSKRKHRSTIAFSLPEVLPEPEPETESQTANIVSFPPLKEAPEPQKPERLTPQEISELTASEKRELILAAIRSGTMRESDYDKMLVMVGLLKVGPADKILDLEDEALLDDIVAVWANQIEPEELAAVLSALRDCDDDLRRNDIIDSMIRIAFEQTQLCGLTEEQWRLRVERRLPKK